MSKGRLAAFSDGCQALFVAVSFLGSGCQLAQGSTATPELASRVASEAHTTSTQKSQKSQKSQTRATAKRAKCPTEMVAIDNYCIDRYEAELLVKQPSGKFVPHPPYLRPPKEAQYKARSRRSAFPQAHISRVEAARACASADKRLCSLSQWYRACRGARDFRFPYGPSFEPRRCNVRKPHLLSRLFGKNPRAWKMEEHFNSPLLNQQPGFLARTGEYSACTSDFGTFDMVGNLHEWVADSVDRSIEKQLPLLDGIRQAVRRNRGHGVLMGGFYSTDHQHGYGCEFITVGHNPTYYDYSTGFRCCRDQE